MLSRAAFIYGIRRLVYFVKIIRSCTNISALGNVCLSRNVLARDGARPANAKPHTTCRSGKLINRYEIITGTCWHETSTEVARGARSVRTAAADEAIVVSVVLNESNTLTENHKNSAAKNQRRIF